MVLVLNDQQYKYTEEQFAAVISGRDGETNSVKSPETVCKIVVHDSDDRRPAAAGTSGLHLHGRDVRPQTTNMR